MKWDQSIFNKNLEFLINVKFNGNQSRFNDKLGRDSATRWKKSRPSLENLLSITEVCECSLDWLLTGKDKQADNCEVKCSEKIAELCKKVKKVVESNTHWGASLEANIHSFHAGVETDKEIVEIKKSIPALLLGSGRKRRGVRAKKTQK